MNETLFLVCPSDCLEARINEQFNTVNYFYTSLGNSFNIDQGSFKNIQELITNHSIKNIYFVLSSDNRFLFWMHLKDILFLKTKDLLLFTRKSTSTNIFLRKHGSQITKST